MLGCVANAHFLINDEPLLNIGLKMTQNYVFLSHSSKDKVFVRKLDAALSGSGIQTFYDERDIKLGESIPTRIYEELGKATHVIYVISENSLRSDWVSEELSIAKMRQKQEKNIDVLPILIDDIALPTAISHVKCLLLKDWLQAGKFSLGVQEILVALGRELIQPSSIDLRFYCKWFELLGDLEIRTARLGGAIQAANLAYNYMEGSVEARLKGTHWILYRIWDDDSEDHPMPEMEKFIDIYNKEGGLSGTKVEAAVTITKNILPLLRFHIRSFRCDTYEVHRACINLVACLQELRNEFSAITASHFSLAPIKPSNLRKKPRKRGSNTARKLKK